MMFVTIPPLRLNCRSFDVLDVYEYFTTLNFSS